MVVSQPRMVVWATGLRRGLVCLGMGGGKGSGAFQAWNRVWRKHHGGRRQHSVLM